MKLTSITIEEIQILGIARFYILEEGDHLISIKSQGNSLYIWNTYKQEWRIFFSSGPTSFDKLKKYINKNNYPVYIKLNKETNDTNSK